MLLQSPGFETYLFFLKGCGSVVNNTLKSPGYPNNYPDEMDCSYTVPIPNGRAMEINFHDFNLEEDELCR